MWRLRPLLAAVNAVGPVDATLWQLCELHLMVEGTRIALSTPILHPEHCEDRKRMFLEILHFALKKNPLKWRLDRHQKHDNLSH